MKQQLVNECIYTPLPVVIPTIGYVASKEALAEHNARVDADYQGLSALKIFNFDTQKNELKGSNIPGTNLLVRKTLAQAGYEFVTLQDLEDARAMHTQNPVTGMTTKDYCYVDTGIVIRAETPETSALVAQIRKHDARLAKLNKPVVILMQGFEPQVEAGSIVYHLTDAVTQEGVMYAAPEYAGENKQFSTLINGRPQTTRNGNRTIWNNASAISGLCLNRILDVVADNDNLVDSDGSGRVVVKRGAAAGAKMLEHSLTEQNANFATLEAQLRAQYEANRTKIQALASELKIQ